MVGRRFIVAFVVAALALLGASPSRAEVLRHSGIVRGVDLAAGVVTLDETGRWLDWQGVVVIATWEIFLTPSTRVTRLSRQASARGGSHGDYVERGHDVSTVRPGDLVTVTCVHEGKRLTAVSLTVLALGEPPSAPEAP